MTRKEAVEKLRLFDFIGSNEDEEFLTALDMAIKALEQCDDAISRQEAIKAYSNIRFPVYPLENLPSVHAEPRKGHWIKAQQRGITTYSDAYAECDCCHDEQGYEPTYMGWGMKYCPNCGARMVEK